MARKDRTKPLTAIFVRNVKQTGRYGDGGRGSHGLYLRVHRMKSGRLSKSWGQRLRIGGKPTNIGLGPYPVVTLAEARAKALHNRREAFNGRDPRAPGIPTLAAAAEKVIAFKAESWKAGSPLPKQWRQSLRDYAFPKIGSKRVDLITTADVLAVLRPIWNEKRATAKRVRQRLGAIMDWAIAQGYREGNPARDASAALPKNGGKAKHHRALPSAKVADALARVRASGTRPATRLCLEFVALTAVRSGEARGSTWSEIDVEAALWTIPAERMKGGRAHRVPLSSGALAILREAREHFGGSGLVFPSHTGRPLIRLSRTFQKLGIPGTAHGLRSSFRDWCSENSISRELGEACLSHRVGNAVELAYKRSDLLQQRRAVMQRWSEFLDG